MGRDEGVLALHLKAVIRSRVSHELARLQQFPRLPFDRISERFEQELSSAMESGASDDDSANLDADVDEAITSLRALAVHDALVQQLLDAYEERATERNQVMHVTGMSAASYHNAHRRMLRLAQRLPGRQLGPSETPRCLGAAERPTSTSHRRRCARLPPHGADSRASGPKCSFRHARRATVQEPAAQ